MEMLALLWSPLITLITPTEGRTHHGGLSKVICGAALRTRPITLRDVRVGGHFRQYNLPAVRNRKMRGCMTRRFVLHADQSERVPRHDLPNQPIALTTPQCIMKKRPASEGRGCDGRRLRCAALCRGFAPLRRR